MPAAETPATATSFRIASFSRVRPGRSKENLILCVALGTGVTAIHTTHCSYNSPLLQRKAKPSDGVSQPSFVRE